MPQYEELHRRARFCLALAGMISDPGHKAALLEMAERWRKLAEGAAEDDSITPCAESAEREL